MIKFKVQNKLKVKNLKYILYIYFGFFTLNFGLCGLACAQDVSAIELTLDASATTVDLPKIFKPSVDLSGRGFNREITWPQGVAEKKVLDLWQKEVGFSGFFRMQYNLWEINQLYKNKPLQEKLKANYESIIKKINDADGTVILDLFGMPAGLGKVLDIKSPPHDYRGFKNLIKNTIRDLSCIKRLNIWYEVWTSPDSEDFFLGRRPEYFRLYRTIAECVRELEAEYKIHIPIGGPSISWWFQSIDGNTIVYPENALIYELIRYCYYQRLPLDFVSWHGYSTDPAPEKALTLYNQNVIQLIRTWLSYFHLNPDIPLIVDEWNFDRNGNVLAERQEKSYVSASYIPSRIRNMYEAGLNYQIYYCLEDFDGNKEGVVRNVGLFSFDADSAAYKGKPKLSYYACQMLNSLGPKLYPLKINDEFAGVIATKTADGLALILYNYIDPDIANNYLSRNICTVSSTSRKMLLNLIRSRRMDKILNHELDVQMLGFNNKFSSLLKRTVELNDQAKKLTASGRSIKLNIKNLQGDYQYERFTIDAAADFSNGFPAAEKKTITIAEGYQEAVNLTPYSIQFIVLKKVSQDPTVAAAGGEPVENNKGNVVTKKE